MLPAIVLAVILTLLTGPQFVIGASTYDLLFTSEEPGFAVSAERVGRQELLFASTHPSFKGFSPSMADPNYFASRLHLRQAVTVFSTGTCWVVTAAHLRLQTLAVLTSVASQPVPHA